MSFAAQYAFPYVKKRIGIAEKRIVELSPIEVALDEMRQRVQELEDVTLIGSTDVKKLQLRLQGSICVTVNAGPLAYASAFLDPALSPQYPDDKVDELKDVFRYVFHITISRYEGRYSIYFTITFVILGNSSRYATQRCKLIAN